MGAINRYVITGAQNDTEINEKFYNTLLSFCSLKNAEFMVLPTKYLGKLEFPTWDSRLDNNLVTTEKNVGKNLKILGDLFLLASVENPLSGFEVISKGRSVIIGHTQLQMKHLPVSIDSHPILLTTTGSITVPNVPGDTKTGKKANFNHSYSALYISILDEGKDTEEFQVRVLNFDGTGFYDIDGYYSGTKYTKGAKVEALILGDEHVIEISETVKSATYTNADSIIKTLRPKYTVHHDIFSARSCSHHDDGKVLTQIKKTLDGIDDVENELKITCEFLLKTVPNGVQSLIVPSNHNDHLDQWLENPETVKDTKNAQIYHWLMLQKTLSKNRGKSAFEIYLRAKYPALKEKVVFLDIDKPFKIHGIELQNHGHKGANGNRNGLSYFPKHHCKVIHGHYHSAAINKGSYCVGTSTGFKLSYTSGLTNWTNSHCLIYPNGKRQMINIIRGKWFL